MSFTGFSGAVGSDTQFTTFFYDGASLLSVCPDAGCGTGIGPLNKALSGTSYFEFWESDAFGGGAQTRNGIQFVSAEQDVVKGQSFKLGSITFSNGIWFTAPAISVIFQSHSTDPALNGFIWNDTIELGITPNDFVHNTPEQNADFIYFDNLRSLGSIRAYELKDSRIPGDNTVTVDLYGAISSLDLQRFANASGAGFIDPSIALAPTVSAAPEPPTLALLATGLAGLLLALRRHGRRDRAAAT
jgi:hypothetical protein